MPVPTLEEALAEQERANAAVSRRPAASTGLSTPGRDGRSARNVPRGVPTLEEALAEQERENAGAGASTGAGSARAGTRMGGDRFAETFDDKTVKQRFHANDCVTYVKSVLKDFHGWDGRNGHYLKDSEGIRPGDMIFLKAAGGNTTQHRALVYQDPDGNLRLNELVTNNAKKTKPFSVNTSRTLDQVMPRVYRVYRPQVKDVGKDWDTQALVDQGAARAGRFEAMTTGRAAMEKASAQAAKRYEKPFPIAPAGPSDATPFDVAQMTRPVSEPPRVIENQAAASAIEGLAGISPTTGPVPEEDARDPLQDLRDTGDRLEHLRMSGRNAEAEALATQMLVELTPEQNRYIADYIQAARAQAEPSSLAGLLYGVTSVAGPAMAAAAKGVETAVKGTRLARAAKGVYQAAKPAVLAAAADEANVLVERGLAAIDYDDYWAEQLGVDDKAYATWKRALDAGDADAASKASEKLSFTFKVAHGLVRAPGNLARGILGFKFDLATKPEALPEGILRPFVAPVSSFKENPVDTVAMWLLVGRDVAHRATGAKTARLLRESREAFDAGHTDLGTEKLIAWLTRSPEYQAMAPGDRIALQGDVRRAVERAPYQGMAEQAAHRTIADVMGHEPAGPMTLEQAIAAGEAEDAARRAEETTATRLYERSVLEPAAEAAGMRQEVGDAEGALAGRGGEGYVSWGAEGRVAEEQRPGRETEPAPEVPLPVEPLPVETQEPAVAEPVTVDVARAAEEARVPRGTDGASLEEPVRIAEGDRVIPFRSDLPDMWVTRVEGEHAVLSVDGDGYIRAPVRAIKENASIVSPEELAASRNEMMSAANREAYGPMADIADQYLAYKRQPPGWRLLRTYKVKGESVERPVRADLTLHDVSEIAREMNMSEEAFQEMASDILNRDAKEYRIVTPTATRNIGEVEDMITNYELRMVRDSLRKRASSRSGLMYRKKPATGTGVDKGALEAVFEARSESGQPALRPMRGETSAPAPKLADQVVAQLDSWEQAARDRMAARGSKLASGIDPQDLADVAIIGATRIAKGAVRFAEWSAEMVREFGEDIRPHLDDVWKRSVAFYESRVRATLGENAPAVESRTPSRKSAPEAGTTEPGVMRRSPGNESLEMEMAQPVTPRKAVNGVPKTTRQIVKDIESVVGPIRVGRFLRVDEEGRPILGVYKPHEQVMRIGSMMDLPTTAHEVGHAIHTSLFGNKRTATGELSDASIPKEFIPDLKLLSEGLSAAEGFAEYVRLWVTAPDGIKRRMPEFTTFFERELGKRAELDRAMRQLQGDYQEWLALPAKQKILSTVSVNENEPTREWTWGRLYAAAVDALDPLRHTEMEMTGGGNVKTSSSAFRQAWLTRGWAGKADEWVNHGITDQRGRVVGSSLKERIAPVKDRMEDFRAFAISRHALDVIDRLGEDAMPRPRSEYESVVAEAPREFHTVLDSLVGFQAKSLELLVDSGFITRDYFNELLRKWPHHIPLYQRGMEDGIGAFGPSSGKGYANLPEPVRPLHGQTKELMDPLEAIVRDTFLRISLAERNGVMTKLIDLGNMFEGTGWAIEKVNSPQKVVRVKLEEILDPGEVRKAEEVGISLEKIHAIFRRASANLGKENIVRVWRNGVEEYYQLDPELYRAIQHLDAQSSHELVRFMAIPAAMLRAGATLTPAFIVRNPVRDVQTAFHNSAYAMNPLNVVHFAKALRSALGKDETFHQWRAVGGAQASMGSIDRKFLQEALYGLDDVGWVKSAVKDMQHAVKDIRGRKTLLGKVGATAGGVADAFYWLLSPLRAVSETMETTTRLAEFGKGTKWGKENSLDAILDAAIASRDVTVDFSRSGYLGKEYNKVTAFFNAQIQGLDAVARRYKQAPAKHAMRGFLWLTIPTVLLYMRNRNIQDYKDRNDYEKDTFWLWYYDEKKPPVRIPKPFELGLMYATIPERILRRIDKDPDAFDNLFPSSHKEGQGMGESLMSNTAAEILMPSAVPTFMVPLLQVMTNTSFTGAPIVSESDKRLPPALQYNSNTTAVARLIGAKLGLSPKQIDTMMIGHTGGVGKWALRGISSALEESGAVDTPPRPARNLSQEVLSALGVGANEFNVSIDVDRTYREKTELLQREALAEAGMTKPLTEQENQRIKELQRLTDALAGLRKVSREILAAESEQDVRELAGRWNLPASGDIHQMKYEMILALVKSEGKIVKSDPGSELVSSYRDYRYGKKESDRPPRKPVRPRPPRP